MNSHNNTRLMVYVGTYTSGNSVGIYVYRLDPVSGALDLSSETPGISNPSYLAIAPNRKFLYAISEDSTFRGRETGSVSAFSIAEETGELHLINQQPSGGTIPCYISVHKDGRFLVLANYGTGSVAVFPIQTDGSLGKSTDLVQHEGSSINEERQSGPHAHSVLFDPTYRYVFSPDLGLDKVLIYKLDETKGKLMSNDQAWEKVPPGSGPRHLDFHPNGKFAYVIHNLNSSLSAFSYDEKRGALRVIQTVPTVPVGFKGFNSCADIHVSPSGRYLYGSNRGHDSIVLFSIDQNNGQLTYLGNQSTLGKSPRNFLLDHTGKFLFAANQGSNSIVTFRVDQETGSLEPTQQVVEVPSPVCMKLMRVF